MAKYRKKPVIIEAEQWFSNIKCKGVYEKEDDFGTVYYVITIHKQKVYLEEGDYIIPEPDGVHYYPCKPDIFEKTYEKVED